MSNENPILLQDEEDVVLEGSELHQALTDMGYTNFNAIPKVKEECNSLQTDSLTDLQGNKESLSNKINAICHYLLQSNELRRKQLEIILKSNILLDDHAETVNEFLINQPTTQFGKYFGWFQFIGSTATAVCTLVLKKKSITTNLIASTVCGFSIYKNFKYWKTIKELNNFVELQKELHNLIKQSLKILRRTYKKKSIIAEVHERSEILGHEKYTIAVSLKQQITEVFENLSAIYHLYASKILEVLPYSLRINCQLTKITDENDTYDNNNYEKIKNLYYMFILVQSEMMFIMANAYNSQVDKTVFQIMKINLSQILDHLTTILIGYCSKMRKTLQEYQICEIEPIHRVFKGIPNSKWQDTYIHLDLTSQKIQEAFKEVTSILEVIDALPEQDENNFQLIESITEKMNEAYKQIENARSFAEFSSLLIAKAQHKHVNDSKKENENENLFPVSDNRTIIVIDKEPVIEDEVFEEYIKEEYLKPLYEISDASVVENFRLDKLLEKHFMSELKEALIDKQKSMTERELKALKRMYDKMHKESYDNKIELNILDEKEKSIISRSVLSLPLQPEQKLHPKSQPPPPPPPPPPILENTIIAETEVENTLEKRKERTPIPLPRVKMYKPDEETADVQRFSINHCIPKISFPPIGLVEETFLGSGENSEEEETSDNNSETNEDLIEK